LELDCVGQNYWLPGCVCACIVERMLQLGQQTVKSALFNSQLLQEAVTYWFG
jgi:hypothetical protein